MSWHISLFPYFPIAKLKISVIISGIQELIQHAFFGNCQELLVCTSEFFLHSKKIFPSTGSLLEPVKEIISEFLRVPTIHIKGFAERYMGCTEVTTATIVF